MTSLSTLLVIVSLSDKPEVKVRLIEHHFRLAPFNTINSATNFSYMHLLNLIFNSISNKILPLLVKSTFSESSNDKRENFLLLYIECLLHYSCSSYYSDELAHFFDTMTPQ